MRALADRYQVLLIFDEVVTFRTSLGGYQELESVLPDLTTLGKIIGGGFAIGAFGGRQEFMAEFDPASPTRVIHSGTFNGHSVAMAAGIAMLEDLDQVAIQRIDALGERLRKGLNQVLHTVGIKARASGIGSLVPVYWGEGEIVTSRDASLHSQLAGDLPQLLHLALLNRGVFSTSRGWYNLSTAMTEREVDRCIEAFGSALCYLKPYVAESLPHLVSD
jgi:glutamate-1-semialdehyde 2,1-aminomutase